jgi:L-iditol 2-dehydrogenase
LKSFALQKGDLFMQMQCVQVTEIGSFNVTKVPVPKPGSHELLIKVMVTGLCRTDLKLIRVGHRDLLLPRIPGEEVVGAVHAKGSAVEGFKEGDMVYVYPGIWCDQCSACRSGAENLCRQMQIMGFHRDGGFADFVVVSEQSVIRVPDHLAAEEAVFSEPLSCCLNALELGGVEEGKTVGIWGAGPAGTLLARASQAMGAVASNIDPDNTRSKRINGYSTCPDQHFDICVVAVGAKTAYEEAVNRLNPSGRLVVFSGLSPDDNHISVSFNQLHYHQQTIVGAYGCCYRHGIQALDLISGGDLLVKDLISHKMRLHELDEALDIVDNRTGMKVLLYPNAAYLKQKGG